eukprot:CAMPEP_0175065716 /NCGR_PEP_ID=MMETSP0052_2-20121109/16091_1 /TAXON_ID=51329 ORGANISM="Polytomella parva, Strain SAG 63-3" /NCGR_SAMPLE_ID=MMETSP0052_2 /ASSEMBLY_ACC=CAM_ASM_000194 /LENGTH=552 /DNA_ID=CAMNT_0016332305 /DNA_START=24 /DNA_END=1679 /DNA_ORIENTATION=-
MKENTNEEREMVKQNVKKEKGDLSSIFNAPETSFSSPSKTICDGNGDASTKAVDWVHIPQSQPCHSSSAVADVTAAAITSLPSAETEEFFVGPGLSSRASTPSLACSSSSLSALSLSSSIPPPSSSPSSSRSSSRSSSPTSSSYFSSSSSSSSWWSKRKSSHSSSGFFTSPTTTATAATTTATTATRTTTPTATTATTATPTAITTPSKTDSLGNLPPLHPTAPLPRHRPPSLTGINDRLLAAAEEEKTAAVQEGETANAVAVQKEAYLSYFDSVVKGMSYHQSLFPSNEARKPVCSYWTPKSKSTAPNQAWIDLASGSGLRGLKSGPGGGVGSGYRPREEGREDGKERKEEDLNILNASVNEKARKHNKTSRNKMSNSRNQNSNNHGHDHPITMDPLERLSRRMSRHRPRQYHPPGLISHTEDDGQLQLELELEMELELACRGLGPSLRSRFQPAFKSVPRSAKKKMLRSPRSIDQHSNVSSTPIKSNTMTSSSENNEDDGSRISAVAPSYCNRLMTNQLPVVVWNASGDEAVQMAANQEDNKVEIPTDYL